MRFFGGRSKNTEFFRVFDLSKKKLRLRLYQLECGCARVSSCVYVLRARVCTLAGRDADEVFLGRSKTQKNAVFLERPKKNERNAED